MLHKQKLKIMELFFEEPARSFQLREISRLTKMAPTSVRHYLKELSAEKLIGKHTKTIYPSYSANETNRLFKIYKQQTIILKLYLSGLIDYLEEQLHPASIILFGSVRKGEYTKKSDIDLFIQAEPKELDLNRYRKQLKHRINIFYEEDISKISKELLNNIINGIKLSGYLKIR